MDPEKIEAFLEIMNLNMNEITIWSDESITTKRNMNVDYKMTKTRFKAGHFVEIASNGYKVYIF